MEKLLSFRIRIIIGLMIWSGWTAYSFQYFLHASWGRILLLLAPLFIVPLILKTILKIADFAENKLIQKIEFRILLPAIFFAVSFLFEKGFLAALFSAPWLIMTVLIAWAGWKTGYFFNQKNNTAKHAIGAGMIYLLVGGVWAFIDRIGWRPLAYDPEIVFLTVAHFHYAGFVLPIVAGFVFNELKDTFSKIVVYGIISGVLLVAAGIVFTQLGYGPNLESIAAWWLALSAILLAFLQIKISINKSGKILAAICWSLGSVALVGGMILAGLYGMRHVFPIPNLDIPMMRFLHGSANVLGFAMFSVLGWFFYFRERKLKTEITFYQK
ncbi:MAG: YndJ family transporter [Bacteroidota bacterium]